MSLKRTLPLICILFASSLMIQLAFSQEVSDEPVQDFEPEFIEVEQEVIDDSEDEGRSLSAAKNMRIVIDYEHVTAGTEEFKFYVKTHLVPSVTNYFQAALKIRHPVISKIRSSASKLCGFKTPEILQGDGVEGDMVIFVNTRDGTGSWMAATSLCALSTASSTSTGVIKPLIVNIGININIIKTIDPETNPLTHDLYLNVLAHEFIHALAMNGPLYKYFVDRSNRVRTDHIKTMEVAGMNRSIIDVSPLTYRLRQFYGCDSVPGIFMETSGGAHLERRYYQYEVMSTGATLGAKITEISLGFLEATGWYMPDYNYAEPYFFGKGQGCGFIFGDCNAEVYDDEYCLGTGLGCNAVGESGAYCKGSATSEYCRSYISQREFNCENPSGIYYSPFAARQVYGRGLGSKCFSGNLTTKASGEVNQITYCLTYNCVGKGADTVVEVNFGDNNFVCKEKGPLELAGFRGAVNCPDPLTFCNTVGKKVCKRNCMGQGDCVDGECKCYKGFKGTDCGYRTL